MSSLRLLSVATPRPLRLRRLVLAYGLLATFVLGARAAHARRAAAAAVGRPVPDGASVTEGWAGMAVAVFFDPLCPACALLYRNTRAAVRDGRLRLQWIPVAILGPLALLRGAQLLALGNRAGELDALFHGHAPAPAAARRVEVMLAVVQANTAVLQRICGGAPRTPSLLAEDRNGALRLQLGVPEFGVLR